VRRPALHPVGQSKVIGVDSNDSAPLLELEIGDIDEVGCWRSAPLPSSTYRREHPRSIVNPGATARKIEEGLVR
jgi:hypothetical protein